MSENILGELAAGLENRVATKQTGDMTSYIAYEDGRLITGTIQDCTPILEQVARLRQAGAVGSSEMRLAARLPESAIEMYCNTHGITFAEWLQDPIHARRMYTDPDLSGFRVWRAEDDIRSVGGFSEH